MLVVACLHKTQAGVVSHGSPHQQPGARRPKASPTPRPQRARMAKGREAKRNLRKIPCAGSTADWNDAPLQPIRSFGG